MGAFVKGDIIVLPFPFSDLSANKRRPALVLASLPGDELLFVRLPARYAPIPIPWLSKTRISLMVD